MFSQTKQHRDFPLIFAEGRNVIKKVENILRTENHNHTNLKGENGRLDANDPIRIPQNAKNERPLVDLYLIDMSKLCGFEIAVECLKINLQSKLIFCIAMLLLICYVGCITIGINEQGGSRSMVSNNCRTQIFMIFRIHSRYVCG